MNQNSNVQTNPYPVSNYVYKVDQPFLFAALASLLASVVLWFLVNRDYGVFVGLWVPSILILWVGIRVALLTKSISQRRKDQYV